jgi:hypothetical protein
MKLDELIGQKLRWTQPHAFKLKYELKAGNQVIATLLYPRFFDTFATAESADGTWTFQGGDFRQPTVHIRTAGTDMDLAVFQNNMWRGGGILDLLDGRKYAAHATGYKAGGHVFKTMTNELLVSYRNIEGPFHMSAQVQIHRRAEGLIELPWMVMLGWHLVLVL